MYLNFDRSFAKLAIKSQGTFAVSTGRHFVVGFGLKLNSANSVMLTCQSLTIIVICAALFNINASESIARASSFDVGRGVQVVGFIVDFHVANASAVTVL